MALDIPMPDSPGDSLIKGLGAGGDMMHKMMLNKYYGQLHPSGDVANAMYVEQLRNQYGENDPRYIEAKRAHNLALQGRESLIGYRNVLNQTAGIRATSPLGKLIAEGKGQGAMDILRGNGGTSGRGTASAPGDARYKVGNQYFNEEGDYVEDNNSRSPQEREAYERKIAKETGDEDARKRMRFAENMDITRGSINPDDLTHYSGLKGTAHYLWDAGQAALGRPSQQFMDNQSAVKAANLMSKQMRQFYGDSIQPTATARLDDLANPSTWYKDPKVAKAQWEQLNKILDKETQTYKKYGTSPITLNKLEFKNGQFTLGKGQGKQATDIESESEAPNYKSEAPSSSAEDDYLEKAAANLVKVNPNYTAENIRSTAKETGKTVRQVINALIDRAGIG